jgi:hypothetical protein
MSSTVQQLLPIRRATRPGMGRERCSETANHCDHVHIATDGGGYPTGNEKYLI